MAFATAGHVSVIEKLATTVIDLRHAARLVRQEGLDGGPFIIGEFVAHDSRLQFGSLNHALDDDINRQRPIAADTNTLILLPLSGHSGHGGPCCWPRPGGRK